MSSPNTTGAGILDCQWVGATATRAAGSRACNAASGYDGSTGVGTPNGLASFKPLCPDRARDPQEGEAGQEGHLRRVRLTDPYPGGSLTGFSWKVQRGGHTESGSGTSFSFKVKKPGKYTVTLAVTDSYGFTGSTTVKVKVKAAHHHKHHHQHRH